MDSVAKQQSMSKSPAHPDDLRAGMVDMHAHTYSAGQSNLTLIVQSLYGQKGKSMLD